MATDPKVCDLAAALARMGGNAELLRQTAEFCREDMPVYLSRLNTAIEQQNADGVRHAAHSIKGLLVNFDAAAAIDIARRLEQMGHTNDLRDVGSMARKLEEEVTRLWRALEDEWPGERSAGTATG